ncbi:hypothetical protein [Paenibacillus radicis (ex Xue et al. 2023)]|uniref:Rubredoxin-like domain-containing protein n=1 Tax=Paenibacillus radicis (ex Xue et al. 2023) TaxID=2972489 RepID=A0ABT1YJU7_9BACL|nr:hypothetical protein [Paenibacillus radicis (ex Xue et al. 2023)]MCR8633467.1 hypothetical protein [Paenibacillus radicis (ex Xue et al. 2023)]
MSQTEKVYLCGICDGEKIQDGEVCWGCNGIGFDVEGQDDPVCPNCGKTKDYVDGETFGRDGWIDEAEGEIYCVNCRSTYRVMLHLSYSYTSIVDKDGGTT